MKCGRVLFAILLLLSFVVPSCAHVPVMPSGNNMPETAASIQDPLKSYAVYNELKGGNDIHYYRFHMNKGDALHLSLFVPEKGTFIPSLAIMGPGIVSVSKPPPYLEIPDGAGVLVVEGKLPDSAFYEPFTPASYYNLAEIDLIIPEEGDYYAAVYEPSASGSYGIAIGSREEFAPIEWIMVPLNVIDLRLWEGQTPGFIFAPVIATFMTGIILLNRKRKIKSLDISGLTGSTGALLYIGSGVSIFIQMINAVIQSSLTPGIIMTLLLAVLPILSGLAVLHITLKQRLDMKDRVGMVLLGIAGLIIWAGFIIGPFLVMMAGILPSSRFTKGLTIQT